MRRSFTSIAPLGGSIEEEEEEEGVLYPLLNPQPQSLKIELEFNYAQTDEDLDPFGNLLAGSTPASEGTRPIAEGETLRRLIGKCPMREPTVGRSL